MHTLLKSSRRKIGMESSKMISVDSKNPDEVSNKEMTTSDSSNKLKILFLSADTGGGHRASAEALARQFELLYPGSTYDLLDVITDHAYLPYKNIVKDYKHLSSNPTQWNVLYKLTNTKPIQWAYELHFKLMSESAIRKRIKSFAPDVVISVHPLMNSVPSLSCQKISQETSVHLPFFTVITDLGSAHHYWFSAAKGSGNESRAEKVFIASDQIKSIATSRGKDSVPFEKLVQVGLPIRHDFSLHANLLGDRMSAEGKQYQATVRKSLHISTTNKTVLVMGGGEGVGSLSSIVNALYVECDRLHLNATILVVCGRNEKLRMELLNREWDNLVKQDNGLSLVNGPNVPRITALIKDFCLFRPMTKSGRKSGPDDENIQSLTHEVKVVPLGFVTKMAEYMVVADVLVSKAGPGTIAEATAVGLPILLTNFLPGQEEGNVDFVQNSNCGSYISDQFPNRIAQKVGQWLCSDDELCRLSKSSKDAGNPNAAHEIVKAIGESTLRWKEVKDDPTAYNDEA